MGTGHGDCSSWVGGHGDGGVGERELVVVAVDGKTLAAMGDTTL